LISEGKRRPWTPRVDGEIPMHYHCKIQNYTM
jgi:hypothetical protein